MTKFKPSYSDKQRDKQRRKLEEERAKKEQEVPAQSPASEQIKPNLPRNTDNKRSA